MAKIELTQLCAEMTPAQKIFVQQFYANFDNRGAANRRIINIEPFFFQGAVAGSEFLAYAATKLYICLGLQFSGYGAVSATLPSINVYNEANAVFNVLSNGGAYYDTGAAGVRYTGNNGYAENLYFSRLVFSGIAYITFIGYRVTLA